MDVLDAGRNEGELEVLWEKIQRVMVVADIEMKAFCRTRDSILFRLATYPQIFGKTRSAVIFWCPSFSCSWLKV